MCLWGKLLTFDVLAPTVLGRTASEFALCGGLDVKFTFTDIVQYARILHFFLELAQGFFNVVVLDYD